MEGIKGESSRRLPVQCYEEDVEALRIAPGFDWQLVFLSPGFEYDKAVSILLSQLRLSTEQIVELQLCIKKHNSEAEQHDTGSSEGSD